MAGWVCLSFPGLFQQGALSAGEGVQSACVCLVENPVDFVLIDRWFFLRIKFSAQFSLKIGSGDDGGVEVAGDAAAQMRGVGDCAAGAAERVQ